MRYITLSDLDEPPQVEHLAAINATGGNHLTPDAQPVAEIDAAEPTPVQLQSIEEAPKKRAEQVMELVRQGVSVEEAKRRVPFTLDETTDRQLRQLLTGFYLEPKIQKALVRASRVKVLGGALEMFNDPDLEEREKINAGKLMLSASEAMASDPEVGLKLPDTVVNVDLRAVAELAEKMAEYGYKEDEDEQR